MDAARELNATLVSRADLNDELAIIRIRPDTGIIPWFVPGQYIFLNIPTGPTSDAPAGLKRRPFSIASAPTDDDALEFFVLVGRGDGSAESGWMPREGDRLGLDPDARGSLTLEGVRPDTDFVMISTGTGIAPSVSILRGHRGTGRWRRFVLMNGVRRVSDLGYRAELESVARDDPSFIYLPLVSREPESTDWTGRRGRVQQLLDCDAYHAATGARLDPDACHVFVCGNPEMVGSVKELLVKRGFHLHMSDTPGNVHFEH